MTDPDHRGRAEPVEGPRPSLADAVRAAAQGGQLSIGDLIRSIGGVLGIVEGALPSFVFLVVFQTTSSLVIAVVATLALCAAFVAWRLIRRERLIAAIAGAAGAALSAALALLTARSSNFFVIGIVTNAAYGGVFLISVLVRRPIVGVAVSFLMGDQRTWRADAVKRRLYTWITVLWAGLFAVRLVVEVPLYLSGDTADLGVARLITGVPLYAPLLVLSVLAVQAVYRRARDAGGIVNAGGPEAP